jgi:hypothetical protein
MNWEFWKYFKQPTKPIKPIKKEYVFPCKSDQCLVRSACTKLCDKVEMDEQKLTKIFIDEGACPDCGSERFYKGPCGGLAQNVECSGCGHWFNLGLPLFAQRIHVQEDGSFIR